MAAGGAEQGDGIVRLDLAGTTAFAVTASLAAAVFNQPTKVVAVVVALVLFAIGIFTFLWSYWAAVQRSRTDNIAVAQLYFLVSGVAPRPLRRVMMTLLALQVLIGLGTAIARSSTDGRAGSTLAFGILTPMFGLGLNGLWCARHGEFAPRARRTDTATDTNDESRETDGVPTSPDEMEQNAPHG